MTSFVIEGYIYGYFTKEEAKNLRFMITKFAPKRAVETKNGKKYVKRPKIQRLITPDRLRRKRLLKKFHLERREKAIKDKEAYKDLLKKTLEIGEYNYEKFYNSICYFIILSII